MSRHEDGHEPPAASEGSLEEALIEMLLAVDPESARLRSEDERRRLKGLLARVRAWNNPPAWLLEDSDVLPTEAQAEELIAWAEQFPPDPHDEERRVARMLERWRQHRGEGDGGE